MTAKKDLNKIFDELTERYVHAIERNYKWRYKRAKDKEFIKEELKRGTDFMAEINLFNDAKGKLLENFLECYKRGEDMSDVMKRIREEYGEISDIKPYELEVDGEFITLYLNEEEKALKKLALDERRLMKFLISYIAYLQIQKRLPTMFDEAVNVKDDTENTISYPIKWTSKKDNKNEFVQLIYGLHKSGYINGGVGEITKITEALAEVFKVNLGKGWQANHSTSIHNSAHKNQHSIFRKIQEAYQEYSEGLAKIKRTKPKTT
jgi:hypothetical protein